MSNHAIKSGLMTGVLAIVITLLIYIINPTLLASWWIMSLNIIYISIITYLGIQYRNEEGGGFLSFGKAWIYSMTGLISLGLVSTFFSILLFNVIDPDLSKVVTDALIENLENMIIDFGVDDDKLDEMIESMRSDTLAGFTPIGAMKSFSSGLFFHALLSLITGAIIQKKKPDFE